MIKFCNREGNLDESVFTLRETLMCPTALKFDSDPAFTVYGIVSLRVINDNRRCYY